MNHNARAARFSDSETRLLVTFFASMLWQDGELHADEAGALRVMAQELGLSPDDLHVEWLMQLPPMPEEVDPQQITAGLAPAVLGLASLAASVRPSLAKYEALELLELLLQPELPAPAVLELLAA
jgi:hypothetical protein